MLRVPKSAWIMLGAGALGFAFAPRLSEHLHRSRLTWMTPEEQLEHAVDKTMGTILGRNQSENLTLVVGTPMTPTVKGVYIVAYVGKEVTPTDSFGIGVSDASSGADCLCVATPLDARIRPSPSPHCELPANRLHEVMEELRLSLEQWQVPRLGRHSVVYAVFLHPQPAQTSFCVSRATNTVMGNTTYLGPKVEQVVVRVDDR